MNLRLTCIVTIVAVSSLTTLMLWYNTTNNLTISLAPCTDKSLYTSIQSFEDFNNEIGTKSGEYIVPNVIHFLRFQQNNLTFVDAVCILSAFKNHRPDKILFHTDAEGFVGPYWEKVKNTPGLVYEIHYVTLPDEIFGQSFSRRYHLWHAGDVTRLRILMKYGGIFLDNDVYVVQSLNDLRIFEMVIGFEEGNDACLGTQVLLAHKNARFLRLWLESYRQYHSDQWYHDAGCKPSREILKKRPELVHREEYLLGVFDRSNIVRLYKTFWPEWRNQYTMHLLMRHRRYSDDKENLQKYPYFDENNIKNYTMTFGEMAREAYGIPDV